MKKKIQENSPEEAVISATDMVDLKRDMQHAKVSAWLQQNKQQLIAGAVVLLLLLVGSSVWKEQQLAGKNEAALLYIQATNAVEPAERNALLGAVIQDYAGTGYATLARLQQVHGAGMSTKQEALKALIAGEGAPEFVWQARLDLAELYIAEQSGEGVAELLAEHFGVQYEQMRYFLLSRVAADDAEKVTLMQKSLGATITDKVLAAQLESELALLGVAE